MVGPIQDPARHHWWRRSSIVPSQSAFGRRVRHHHRSAGTAARRRARRRWLIRTVAVVAIAGAILRGAAPGAEAKPKGDTVEGTGTAGTGSFAVDAQARKNKSSGTAVFSLAVGEVVGRVTCVQVEDGLAGISGTLEEGTTAVDPAQSPGFFLFIADGSVTEPGIDLSQLRFEGFVPSPEDCAPQFPLLPARVTSGGFELIDRD